MTEIKVAVKRAKNRTSSQIRLTQEQMDDLGVILSGETVEVVGSNGNGITGMVTPDDTDDEIPLTPKEMEYLGVTVGSRVTISTDVSSGSDESQRRTRRRFNKQDVGNDTNRSNRSDSNDTNDTNSISESTTDGFGDVTYDDIGGLDRELNDIRQMVELPLKRPDLFKDVGVDPPSGVLLHGPPGTGKTLIAQAIANETNARFNKINGPEIMSKYTGESEERLRKIFGDARSEGTAIIFFDEIDSIGTQRDDSSDVENRLVGQLLSLMDGLDSSDDVIVIGATNRADSLDPALRRSGRFDREILIGAPNEKERKEILQIHTEDMPLSENVDLDTLASQTNGFVGADLAALSRESALEAIKSTYKGDDVTVDDVLNGEYDEDVEVTMNEINMAMSRVDPSALRSMSAKTPSKDYSDVGGLINEKQRMEEIVSWPLERSELFNKTNTDTPAGVLLKGPEGVGKTLLAEATSGEFDVKFTRINGAEIFQKYVGESEEKIQDIFKIAEKASPVIIFFEQLDAIAGIQRDSSGSQERVISQLIAEIDAIQNNPTITVIGETNDTDNIDPRLLRSGRFEEEVHIEPPDETERNKILDVLTEDKPLDEDVSIEELASNEKMQGLTGGEIETVVRNASLKSIRESAKNSESNDILISEEHFNHAISRLE